MKNKGKTEIVAPKKRKVWIKPTLKIIVLGNATTDPGMVEDSDYSIILS